MKHTILSIILISIFLIGLVAASTPEEPDDSFKVNTAIDYKKPCFLPTGDYCSGSAICNLTVFDKNNLVIVNNKQMTNAGTYHNATINPYSRLGVYKVDMVCSDAGLSGSSTFYYELTPSGNPASGTLIALFYLVVIALYSITFIGFFGRSEWVTILGGMGMIVLGIYTINNGIIIYRDVITDIFSWTTIGLGAFFSLFTGASIINENM